LGVWRLIGASRNDDVLVIPRDSSFETQHTVVLVWVLWDQTLVSGADLSEFPDSGFS
jgi:hypothetical protein